MATVTSKTAAAMQAIFDSAISSVAVVGDDLHLTLRDGTIINAGNVRGDTGGPGPTVCTSTTRPSSPTDSQHIFETDTLRELVWYNAKAGWFPQWNIPWGIIGKHRLTVGSAIGSVSNYTDMIISNVPFRNDRQYQIGFDGEVDIDNAGIWLGDIRVNSAPVGRVFQINAPAAHGDYVSGSILYTPATSGTWSVRLYATEFSGSATFDMPASTSVPRTLWVRDIGPV